MKYLITGGLGFTYLNYQLSCIRMPVRKAESNVKTISTLENFISIKEGLEKTFLWYLKNGS